MGEFNLNIFLLGCLGGIVPEVIRFTKNYEDIRNNEYYKQPMYYISLLCLSLLGGLIVWLLEIKEYLPAVLCGFSAPEIFTRLAAKNVEEVIERELSEYTQVEAVSSPKESVEDPENKDEEYKETINIAPRKNQMFSFRSWWAR